MNKQMILDPFQNVGAAAATAVCDCNKLLGSVLESMTLTLGGGAFTKAMITSLVLKGNGKPIYETTGTNLDAAMQYNGQQNDATVLKIDFMDRKARTVNAWQAGALDLSAGSGITSLRLEVVYAGATTPTLVGFADVSPPVDPRIDPASAKAEEGIRWLIARKHRATQTIGAAGVPVALAIPHLDPAGGGSNYRRIYIYSANCTAIKTVREGVTEHELTKLQNEASQKGYFKVPQANLVVFDPVQDGSIQGRTWDTRPASGVRSAQFYATFSAGETITIETDELIPFGAY
jgi:Viral coat protein P2 N-terminal domain